MPSSASSSDEEVHTKSTTKTKVSHNDGHKTKVTTTEHKSVSSKHQTEREHHESKRDSLKHFPEKLRSKLPGHSSTSSSSHTSSSKSKSVKSSSIVDATKGIRGDFVNDCLEAHNKVRKEHRVEPLKLNREMCKYSEEWAKALAEKDKMEHGPNKDYGENIYSLWSNDPGHTISGGDPIENWYHEAEKHDYDNESKELKTGHFTQIVWKNSTELGVGIAKSKNNTIFLVLTYNPPGNVSGQFGDNVFRAKTKEPSKIKAFIKGLVKTDSTDSSDIDSSDDDEDTQKQLNKEGIALHNEYRKKHGVPSLKYSKKLQRYAKEWAKRLAEEDKLEHRPGTKHGENIFCVRSSDPKYKVTAREACESWYKEINDHDFDHEPSGNLKSGHFTQMIWRDTDRVGMAIARNDTGRILVVANYSPAGNMGGKFRENVPRLLTQ